MQTDWEYRERTKIGWKGILLCVLFAMIFVATTFMIMIATDTIRITPRSNEHALPATQTAIISMPDGSVKTIKVSSFQKDVRYHTSQLTIIDDTGTPWYVDSRNVVITDNTNN